MTTRTVVVDGVSYRITPRPADGILVYKKNKTGEYKGQSFYRYILVWNSKKDKTPKLGSTLSRVLAAIPG